MTTGERAAPASAWAPLRVRAFRALWTAQLFSMIGTWMQTVGAQWLLVDEPNAATLVGLVQAAAMLPTLVLALPSGALADIVDRRRLLVGRAGVPGGRRRRADGADRDRPADARPAAHRDLPARRRDTLTIPAYQVLVQELVGREQMRSATALNGVAMNLARAVGPGHRRTAGRADRRGRGVRAQRAELSGVGRRSCSPCGARSRRSTCCRSASSAP